jgi:tight adherence protein B
VFADLLLPFVLLLFIAAGFLMVLKASRDRKGLQKRLLSVVPAAGARPTGSGAIVGIRIRRDTESRASSVARLLNVPKDVPLANILAPPVVFVIGIVSAVLFYLLGQYFLSQTTSVFAGLGAGVMMVRGVFGWEITRYQAQLVNQLPDTVQLVVSATRAGLPVSEAFKAVAEEMSSPTREEFARVVNEIALGTTADAALLAMYHRTGVTEYAIFAVTIGVQSRSGGRLAETIQNLAEIVRERLIITARAKALSGEAKASGIIMGILPIIAGGITAITQPEQIAILFTDPRGTKILAIGIVTLLLGALTMRQLIAGATKD